MVESLFEKAQKAATHRFLCYVNADIILLNDMMEAVNFLNKLSQPFLGVGQRKDVEVSAEFLRRFASGQENAIREYVDSHGILAGLEAMDYFIFPRGFYRGLEPYLIGRMIWDWRLVQYALEKKALVIDLTDAVTAIHQNHSTLDRNQDPIFKEEVHWNLSLYRLPCVTLQDVTHRLQSGSLEKVWFSKLKRAVRTLRTIHQKKMSLKEFRFI
ncbi:MAG: hypothetical protein A2W80_15130 [Candidatus Riflebacteria bacterium GWC2_50_8]|nr:MAG: hypothetical protein A2W80_15130 [Candidatus Riflebacteria bacterium GWC2_50_8]